MPHVGEQNAAARLTMRGIRRRFGATVALDGVDLDVHAGQVLALVGENGAGKSTLMRILAGALPPDAGTMTLHGQPYMPRDPIHARMAGVAMIYQELSLAPHLSVEANVMLGIEPTRFGFVRQSAQRAAVVDALRELEHSDIHPATPVSRLSIAAQQIVEVARALVIDRMYGEAQRGSVIVLDEPTSSLTRGDVERLFRVVRRLRDRGVAIVYISHFLDEVERIADRFTVLRDGRTVGSGVMRDITIDAMIEMMVGRNIDRMFVRSDRIPGEALLSLDELAGVRLPRRAGLTVHRGEVVGIAGLIGAGRTELLRAVFGLDAVRSGQVRFAAFTGPATPGRRLALGMGMLSEDRKAEGLALNMSLADNLTLSKLTGLGPAGLITARRQRAAAGLWADRLRVRHRHVSQPIRELSGGNQQKVAIARLLYHDVDLFLLDEPTRGIDVGSKAQVYELIDTLAGQGKAVLLVSSYLPELLGVCDRVAVMSRGVLGPAHDARQVTEEQLMREATGAAANHA